MALTALELNIFTNPPPETTRNILTNTTMAPDRGKKASPSSAEYHSLPANIPEPSASSHTADDLDDDLDTSIPLQPNEAAKILAARANEPQNFTFRGVAVGLLIGIIINFSNMYFGLQTGWVSGMAMPSALLGFAYFRTVKNYLNFPFSPVENVLVQSVAGSVGTMPLGCGFVGVVPALEYLLLPEEGGPLDIGLWKLVVWATGIAFFGVVFAVPLRRQVIIRERLKFPSGTATALMIGVLHGEKGGAKIVAQEEEVERESSLQMSPAITQESGTQEDMVGEEYGRDKDDSGEWREKIRLLLISFGISAFYVCFSLVRIRKHADYLIDTRILLPPADP
jgi:hypothetical protein